MGFLSWTFTIHRTADEVGGYFFYSSLPSPIFICLTGRQLANYCREPSSAHRQQPDSNWEPSVFESRWVPACRSLIYQTFDYLFLLNNCLCLIKICACFHVIIMKQMTVTAGLGMMRARTGTRANQEKRGLCGQWKALPKVNLCGLITPAPNAK